MRKSLFLVALALISTGCLAQKSNVKKAKNLALQETPDFVGARQMIAPALENEETKNLVETWYVAGLIGYQEFANAYYLASLGQAIDVDKVGAAVAESYDFWLKADSMGQVLVPNKKGVMVPADPKYRKQINTRMLEYFQKAILTNYGYNFYEKSDNEQAYSIFMKHLNIPTLDMMQDPKLQQKMVMDTLYYTYKYYAGRFAYQAGLLDEAMAVFQSLTTPEVANVALAEDVMRCYEFVAQIYNDRKDTVRYVEQLKAGVERYPKEAWFLQNLINHYIFSGQAQEAINYLNEAILREPNEAQYHMILGNLNENQKNYETALKNFDRALELDATLADAQAGKGRVYYNQAVQKNEDAAYIEDSKAYKQALVEMNELYKQSIPFFEKAHELDAANRDYMIVLKQLYGRFEMNEKRAAIMAEMEL